MPEHDGSDPEKPGEGGTGGSAFVWPPRAVADAAAPDEAGLWDEGPTSGASRDAGDDGGGEEPGSDASRGDDRGWSVGVVELDRWRLLERGVVGAALPSLPLGWRAEDADAACWRCGGTVGIGETDERGCGSCRGKRLAWDEAVRLGAYAGGLRDGIVGCKYAADRESGRRLGAMLGERVAEAIARRREIEGADGGSGSGLGLGRVAVVPVPATLRRRWSNGGVDHALVLARGVAGELGVGVDRVLRRHGGTRQAALSAAARAKNAEGAYTPRLGWIGGNPRIVVLVDDVRTTGATATACVRAVRRVLGGRGSGGTGGRGARGAVWFVLATAAVSDLRRHRAAEESAILGREGGW